MFLNLRQNLAAGALLVAALSAASAQPMPPLPLPRPMAQAAGAPADPAAQQEYYFNLLREISEVFNGVRTMQGDFVQFSPFGDRTEGVFMMQKPGRVRFHYSAPAQVDVISDGNNVLVEDRTAGTWDVYPLSQTPLRHLLANQIDLSSGDIVKTIQEEGNLISLGVTDRSLIEGKLTLIFDKTTLELVQWVTTDAQGYDTSVAIYNVVAGQPIDPAVFRTSQVYRLP